MYLDCTNSFPENSHRYTQMDTDAGDYKPEMEHSGNGPRRVSPAWIGGSIPGMRRRDSNPVAVYAIFIHCGAYQCMNSFPEGFQPRLNTPLFYQEEIGNTSAKGTAAPRPFGQGAPHIVRCNGGVSMNASSAWISKMRCSKMRCSYSIRRSTHCDGTAACDSGSDRTFP